MSSIRRSPASWPAASISPTPGALRERQQPAVVLRTRASLQPALTPRQFEVLGVLAKGNSNKQIAQILAISDSTVSMHLNAAFHALGVHDRTSAAMAYRKMVAAAQESHYDWAS